MKEVETNIEPQDGIESQDVGNEVCENAAVEEVAAEQTITQVEDLQTSQATEVAIHEPEVEKQKVSFDEKVDKTADFIKKYKIPLLCGIIAILALIIGIAIGGAFAKDDVADDSTSSYTAQNEDLDESASLSTSSPTTAPTTAPTTESTQSAAGESTDETADESGIVMEDESVELVVVYYSDLLDSVVYFENSEDLQMSTSDTVSLLNLVLQGDNSVVEVGDSAAVYKVEMADEISADVTKEEMLDFLQDTNASFESINMSVSGDVLTLDVDMSIQIPQETLESIQSSSTSFVVSLALSAISTDLSFSYTVEYQMDGEKLIPIQTADSTIDIGGLGSLTETVANIALSGYTDASADTLLVGYNNMAGEIIADVLNNYGIVTGASASSINITTREK